MGRLIFKAAEVRELYEHARSKQHFRRAYKQEEIPALWLVHDQGVYLMSAGIPHQEDPEQPSRCKLAYARGCSPDDVDWWDQSRELVGGDDFAEIIPLEDWAGIFAHSHVQEIIIDITEDSFALQFTQEMRAKTRTVELDDIV